MNERRSLQLLAEKYEQVREAPYADPEVRRQKDRIYNRIHKDIKAKNKDTETVVLWFKRPWF